MTTMTPHGNSGLVVDAAGVHGTIESTDSGSTGAEPYVVVRFGDARRIPLAVRVLTATDDGAYAYAGRFDDALTREGREDEPASAAAAPGDPGAGDPLVVPVIAEELHVATRRVERVGVRITKTTTERVETVELPLMEEHIDVQRVAINQAVDAVPAVRYEGDVMIVPLVEEVLVTEKRLMLREELHIRKSQVVANRSQQVTLQREEAHVERVGRSKEAPYPEGADRERT